MLGVEITNAFEIIVILCLFISFVTLLLFAFHGYKTVNTENNKAIQQIHRDHKDERREWAQENRKSMNNVEMVVRELTTCIQTANKQATFQINNNGAMGTQDQKGNNDG